MWKLIFPFLAVVIFSGLIKFNVIFSRDTEPMSLVTSQIEMMKAVLARYKLESGVYPQELGVLVEQQYLEVMPRILRDNNFQYSSDTKSYRLIYYGLDGKLGGDWENKDFEITSGDQ